MRSGWTTSRPTSSPSWPAGCWPTGVGMLFALRETAEPDPRLQALPGLRIAGLPVQDACELLQRSISRPVNAAVAERIVVETGGNPLAVVEAARELAPEQLGDGRRCRATARGAAARRPVRAAGAGAARGHPEVGVAGGGGPAGPRRSLVAGGRRAGHSGVRRGAGGGSRTGGLLAGGAVLPSACPVGGLPRCDRGSSAGRPTGPWRRHAIPSSTPFPGPGIWPQPPPGPTKRSPPRWKRPRIEPGAVVAVPPRPRCGNARRC